MKLKIFILTLLVILVCIGTVLPLFQKGFFEVHDNTQVPRVHEMGLMLKEAFPVRWVPDLGYGYGYPIYNFYGPLPYYVGGFFTLFGITALTATKLMIGIGSLLAGVTMFFFSRKFFGNAGGMLSAVVYAYFPYHAVNIYVRGAIGELFAYAFLPLVFLGIFTLLEKKKTEGKKPELLPFALISIGILLTAISHNLSIFMFFVLLIPLALASLFFTVSKKTFFIFLVCSVIFGVLISSFYILPALLEMKYTNVTSQVGGGAAFADHFVCLGQYWNSVWGFGGSVAGCLDGMSFKLSKLNVLLILTTLFLLSFSIYKKRFRLQEKVVSISLVLFIVCLFLTLNFSAYVWGLPFMDYIQYPWRFINFMGLFLAFVAGYIAYFLEQKRKHAGIVCAVIIVGLTMALNGKLFVPQSYTFYPPEYYTDKQYLNFTVSKISDEYMPSGFITPKNPEQVPTVKAELLKTGGELDIVSNDPLFLKVNYNIPSDGVIHLNTAYFPAWKAYLNGEHVPIVQTPKGMNISVVKGEGSLELQFEQTPIEKAGNAISIVAIVVLFIAIIRTSLKQKRHNS